MNPFLQFAPTSRSESNRDNWVVEKVEVGSTIKIADLVTKLVEPALPAPWAVQLKSCLSPTSEEGWCGCKIRPGQSRSVGQTHFSQHKLMFQSSPRSNPILAPCSSEEERKRVSIISQAFLVEDSTQANGKVLAQLAISCKDVNDYCDRPPKVRLPRLEWIFALIHFFPIPSFATAEFRHYSYQFELPKAVRHLFAVKTGHAPDNLFLLRA
jgi:hypothetical protein